MVGNFPCGILQGTKETNTCKIDLGEAQTTIDTDPQCKKVNLGLDLSFQERRLLYTCFEDKSHARIGSNILILVLKKLYKDAAIFTLDKKEYLARYSVLNNLALCPMVACTDTN